MRLKDPSGKQFRDALSRLPEESIEEITITGHASRDGIIFGKGVSGDGLFVAADGTVKYSDDSSSFSSSLQSKLAKGATVTLNGCNTARESWQIFLDPLTSFSLFSRNKEHITRRLSIELPGVRVRGTRGYVFLNEFSNFLGSRDEFIRIGETTRGIGIYHTFINGE